MKTKVKNILIMANYSNRTGFAWNNIYKLFQHLSIQLRLRSITPFVSFSEIKEPVIEDDFKSFEEAICLHPKPANFASLITTLKAIRSRKIDAIYLTDQSHCDISYLLYRLFGVKKIIVHNRISVASPDDPLPENAFRAISKYLIARIPFINCDRVYAVSDFVKRRLVYKAKVPANRVKVILNGIDTTLFRPMPLPASDVTRIYAGGRATKYKGFQYLIEAANILVNQKNIRDFVIDYAGDGPDLEYLKNLANSAGIASYVNFLGESKDTSDLQSKADIIVVPSVWGDACPSAVSEALASGKPLIATRAGGIPEMIGSPDNAILVPHSDAEAIAESIQRLLNDKELAARISGAARTRATEALDIKRYHQDVLDAILDDLQT